MSITLIAIACIAGVTAVGWGVKKNICRVMDGTLTYGSFFYDDNHMCYVYDENFMPNEAF